MAAFVVVHYSLTVFFLKATLRPSIRVFLCQIVKKSFLGIEILNKNTKNSRFSIDF